MSAYIVSTDTINLLVSACTRYGVDLYSAHLRQRARGHD